MHIVEMLRRLADRGPTPWPVLSVYVNTRPVGPQMTTYRPYLKTRASAELQSFLAHTPERESLTVDFARAQHYLDFDLHEETRSVAIFACYAGDDLFDAIQMPIEVPHHLVVVGAVPTLFPLLRLADQASPAAVAVADTGVTRLFSIAMGAIVLRREVRPEEPSAAGASGLAARSARALADLVRDSAAGGVVVGGDEAAAAAIKRQLSPALAPLLLDPATADPQIAEPTLAAQVTALIETRGRAACIAQTRDLVAASSGLLGVDAVMAALREDRAASLFLAEAFPAGVPAWACRSCPEFGAGSPPATCPSCRRSAVEPVALREELGARALVRRIPIHFVPTAAVPAFDDGGGVGALAR